MDGCGIIHEATSLGKHPLSFLLERLTGCLILNPVASRLAAALLKTQIGDAAAWHTLFYAVFKNENTDLYEHKQKSDYKNTLDNSRQPDHY